MKSKIQQITNHALRSLELCWALHLSFFVLLAGYGLVRGSISIFIISLQRAGIKVDETLGSCGLVVMHGRRCKSSFRCYGYGSLALALALSLSLR
jgi:hypothetical protein